MARKGDGSQDDQGSSDRRAARGSAPVRRRRRDLPPELAEVAHGLTVEQADRPAAAQERRKAVRAFSRGRGPVVSPETAFAQFIASRQAKNVAERTVHDYGSFLGLFLTWLVEARGGAGAADIWALTGEDVLAWFQHLYETPNARTGAPRSPVTIQTYARHLLVALRWLQEAGLAAPTLLRGVSEPGVSVDERKRPLTFTDEEVARLFDACVEGDGAGEVAALTARNRALLAVLLDTGVRRRELCSMQVERVDLRNQTLQVEESKTQLRAVGIGKTFAMRSLTTYLTRARPYLAAITRQEDEDQVGPERGPLWLNRDGDPLAIVGVSEFFDRLKRRAEIPHQCSPHVARRYWITRALQAGVPPQDVARQGGVSIEVIMRYYYAATEAEVVQRVSAASPLDRLARAQEAAERKRRGRRSRSSTRFTAEE